MRRFTGLRPKYPLSEPQLRSDFIGTGLTPEVFAAKRGHNVCCFALDKYSYEDKELERWIYRFAQIYKSEEQMERCRKEHLSENEYLEVKQYLEDIISGKIEP